MRSARYLYRASLALAGLGAATVLGGVVVALRSVQLGAPSRELLHSCERFLLPQLTPGRVLVLALGGTGVAVGVRALRALVRRVRDGRRFLRALEVVGQHRIGSTSVLLVAGTQAEAFCAGLLSPRIYVSSPTAELLSGEELEAVVAHEAHHVARRDPLRILLIGVLADALFFLPALRRLKARYEQLTEIAADEAAVRTEQNRPALAGALLLLGGRPGPGLAGVAPERVDHLLGEPPGVRLPAALVVPALATLAIVVGVMVAVASAGPGRVNIALLAAQSCMVAMALAPVAAIGAMAALGHAFARGRGWPIGAWPWRMLHMSGFRGAASRRRPR